VTPGGNEKFSGVIPPGFGNAGNSLDTTLYLPDGNYYFSLETVDGGFIHSGWSDDIAFTVGTNHAPTNIILSNNSMAENQATGTVVGTFSAVDPNAGDTFTYSLATGPGATDNASFSITGNVLKTAEVFNYTVKNSYTIRVRTTDDGGLFYEKQFTITVISNAAEILTYSLHGQVALATINSGLETIAVTVPYGANVTNLVAIFTTSPSITSIKVGNTVQVSGVTPNDFTTPVTYVVTAQDGITIKNWIVTVTVAPSNAKAITAFDFTSPAVTGVINAAWSF
jgi:hypothetical protein